MSVVTSQFSACRRQIKGSDDSPLSGLNGFRSEGEETWERLANERLLDSGIFVSQRHIRASYAYNRRRRVDRRPDSQVPPPLLLDGLARFGKLSEAAAGPSHDASPFAQLLGAYWRSRCVKVWRRETLTELFAADLVASLQQRRFQQLPRVLRQFLAANGRSSFDCPANGSTSDDDKAPLKLFNGVTSSEYRVVELDLLELTLLIEQESLSAVLSAFWSEFSALSDALIDGEGSDRTPWLVSLWIAPDCLLLTQSEGFYLACEAVAAIAGGLAPHFAPLVVIQGLELLRNESWRLLEPIYRSVESNKTDRLRTRRDERAEGLARCHALGFRILFRPANRPRLKLLPHSHSSHPSHPSHPSHDSHVRPSSVAMNVGGVDDARTILEKFGHFLRSQKLI